MIEKCGAEIFLLRAAGVFEDAHARPGKMSVEIDRDILRADVAGEGGIGVGCFLAGGGGLSDVFQKERTALELLDGSLGIEIELANRFNLVSKELDAHRERVMEGEDIQDAAAHGVLTAQGDLRRVFVAGGIEFRDERGAIDGLAAGEPELEALEHFRRRNGVIEPGAGGDDDFAAFAGSEFFQDGEPFGGIFGSGMAPSTGARSTSGKKRA